MLIKRKTGDEKFFYNDMVLPFTLLDFWQWSGSDIINNTNRGILAEYLVASALGVSNNRRIEWAPYDIEYSGLNIEVKSAAYIQSWDQKKTSKISFNINPASKWDRKSGQYSKIRTRSSHFYVLCLLKEKDINMVNPLNLNQWDFYIIPTYVINRKLGSQKTIGLKSLSEIGSVLSTYSDIRTKIDNLSRIHSVNICEPLNIEL